MSGMSFFRSLSGHFPLPQVSDLEASHFELQHGDYPEVASMDEKQVTSTSDRPSPSWVSSLFSRGPKGINSKRAALLERHDSEVRRSADLESLVSTDASTLLDADQETETSRGVSARVISDAIIGLSDGLTVPFALTAGLSTLGNTRIVIFAGLAELTAGAISMGLGGYLGAKSEEDSHTALLSTTTSLATSSPATAASSISTVFAPYELPEILISDLSVHLEKSPHLATFLMHFQHLSPAPSPHRALTCALTIALGYFLGGFIPLVPYFFVAEEEIMLALWWSLGVMACALFAFGYGKTCFVSGWRGRENVWEGCKGGAQMVFVGGVAAGCAMGLVRLFDRLAQR